jgi:hypothetical protein
VIKKINKDQLRKLLEQKKGNDFGSNAQKIINQIAGLTGIRYTLFPSKKYDSWIVYEFRSDNHDEQLNLKRKTASAVKKLGFLTSGTYSGAGGHSNTFKSPEYLDIELGVSIDWVTFRKETEEDFGERTRDLSNEFFRVKKNVNKYSLYLGADKTDKINQYIDEIMKILGGV